MCTHADVKVYARVRSSPAVLVVPTDLLQPLVAFVGPVRRDQVTDIQEAIAQRVWALCINQPAQGAYYGPPLHCYCCHRGLATLLCLSCSCEGHVCFAPFGFLPALPGLSPLISISFIVAQQCQPLGL